MKRPVLHRAGLFAPAGIARTWCGKKLPLTPEHFRVMGEPEPRGWRWCRVCAGIFVGMSKEKTRIRIGAHA